MATPFAEISTVVFDVGNTLHHLDHALIAAVIGRHGHPVTAERVARAEGSAKAAVDAEFRARAAGPDRTRRHSYFEVIFDALAIPPTAAAAVLTELRAEDARRSLWRVMHVDTPAVLAELGRRGLRLAVVSNADGRVAAALAAGGIAEHFAAIIDSHAVGIEKPDPRIFRLALEACGARPADAVYVGDIYEIDVVGARRAGMTPVLIDPVRAYGEVDCVRIETLGQLLDLVPPRG